MEHLIGEKADKKALTEASVATAKRLGSISSDRPAKTSRSSGCGRSRPPA
jgi:hypothetical protein